MEPKSEANTLQAAKEIKIKELQAQEEKLKELQAELAKLNTKIENHEELSSEDTKFIGDLGWITALSVSIAAIASSI
jgi:flavodoxin